MAPRLNLVILVGEKRRGPEVRGSLLLPIVIHLRVPRLGVRILVIDIKTGPRILERSWLY